VALLQPPALIQQRPVLTGMLLGGNGSQILPHGLGDRSPTEAGKDLPHPHSHAGLKGLHQSSWGATPIPRWGCRGQPQALSPLQVTISCRYSAFQFPNRPRHNHPGTGLCRRGHHSDGMGTQHRPEWDRCPSLGMEPAASSPASPDQYLNSL